MHNLIKVKIEGKNVNNYINWLIKNKISIYEMNIEDSNKLYLITDIKNYSLLKNYSKTYEITIIKYYGKKKYLNFINKYKIIFISITISISILFILSKMIFSIDIIYNDKNMVNLISSELSKYNIKQFRFKKSYQELSKIKKNILKENNDKLEWLEIIESGTKYIVKLVERTQKENDNSEGYQSIVSTKNAIITSIKAYNGEKVKVVNDYVRKDEVIISGIIEKPSGEIIYKKSSGIVYGEVWYELDVEYPYYYKEEKLTGKKKEGFVFYILRKPFPLFSYSNYHNFQKDTSIIFENNLLPIRFVREKQYETVIIEDIYTEDEVISKATDYAKEKLLDRNKKIIEIKNSIILEHHITNSKIELKLFFSVIEDITKTIKIDVYN